MYHLSSKKKNSITTQERYVRSKLQGIRHWLLRITTKQFSLHYVAPY
jgi:hypothetical protein